MGPLPFFNLGKTFTQRKERGLRFFLLVPVLVPPFWQPEVTVGAKYLAAGACCHCGAPQSSSAYAATEISRWIP